MEKKILERVTLLGIDCLDINRLIEVAEICQMKLSFASVKLLTSQNSSHPHVVSIPHLSYVEISKFLIKEIHRFIETDYVLIIQHDGFILNAEAWSDSFLKYDYIGAPWWYLDNNVGNGGFSLRSKKLCDVMASDERIKEFHAEDFKICRNYRKLLEEQQIKFAPEYLAKRFSCEGNHKRGTFWDGEFGFHHYGKTNLSRWKLFDSARLWKDRNFILRFLLKTRKHRFELRLPETILSQYVGYYSSTQNRMVITIKKFGGILKASIAGQRAHYNVFNESFFFSDASGRILEFKKYRSYQLVILYEPAGKSQMKSTYLIKRDHLNRRE